MSIKIDSLDVMKAEMDIQERTRMEDTYVRIEDIIDKITNLGVFPPLVWVWSWDVLKDMYNDYKDGGDPDYCVSEDIEDVWAMFWRDADKNGFTLEYGVDDLHEAIRDWLIDTGIVIEAEEDEEEEDTEDEDE